MRLTLDGLVRALRMEAHRLADKVERGRGGDDRIEAPDLPRGGETKRSDDDRAGR
ncbi:MAG: hypothetical protein AB7I79_07280 [Rhizobiaceae bacterium]